MDNEQIKCTCGTPAVWRAPDGARVCPDCAVSLVDSGQAKNADFRPLEPLGALTNEEWALLARALQYEMLEDEYWSYSTGVVDGVCSSRHRMFSERLNEIDDRIGADAVANAITEAEAQCEQRIGKENWEAFQRNDRKRAAALL